VYSGGPNNPISFAGPYITPVTAPGTTQVGYGGSANQFFRSEGGYTSSSRTGNVIAEARSPYAGEVVISWSDPRSSNATSEYIHIHSYQFGHRYYWVAFVRRRARRKRGNT
jgi:hypothetical protein